MKRTLQRQAGGKLEQPSFLQPPITPMPVTAVSRFPVGDWMYEPKWDGFRCRIFRDGNNVFLQSRTGKSLTAAFPEIVKAVLNVDVDQFVLDGEVAIPTDAGFSFDLLVNRLRVSAARLAQEVKANPAIYIAFDILADKSKSLLRASFSRRRRGLEEFFRKYGSGEGPLYLSANTSELGEVQNWINHIGLQLDGVVAKKADAIYDPGNKRAVLKIKRYRTVDCVVGGFRDRQIGSSRNSFLLGLWDSAGQLHYVGSADVDSEQRAGVGKLTPVKTTPFHERQPEQKSHWSGEPSGPWQSVKPLRVAEVRYDHFSDARFRHGCTLLRARPDKPAQDCGLDQVLPDNPVEQNLLLKR